MWYAASYAEFVNQKIHDVTEEERKGPCLHLQNIIFSRAVFSRVVLTSDYFSVLREQEKNWPCYECNRRFVSSEQLQQHLNMHDEKLNSITK